MKITDIDVLIKEFRNGWGIWSRANVELAVREIERLRKRIAELEAERRWIHEDKTMIVKKDGDSWCFVLPDFVNLQESEAEFVEGTLCRSIEDIYKRLLPTTTEGKN